MSALYIFIGGGLGSVIRYLIGKGVISLEWTSFPLGTFVANILACSILAILTISFDFKSNENTWLQPLLMIGFCGGLSTFSTFSNETVQLIQTGHLWMAIANIIISVTTGVSLILFIYSRTN